MISGYSKPLTGEKKIKLIYLSSISFTYDFSNCGRNLNFVSVEAPALIFI